MKKGKTIAVANQKGGIGKTTTTFNLGACLAEQGKKVLCIDMNDQGDLTYLFGNDEPDELNDTIADVMMCVIEGKDYDIRDYIREYHNMHYIACNTDMSLVDLHIIGALSREYILKRILQTVKGEYDYILLDCGPTLGMLTVNAFVAADSVIIPSEAETFSAKAITNLIKSVLRVREILNPNLDIEGILFTKVKDDYNISKKNIRKILDKYNYIVQIYDFVVPALTEASNAIENQTPLILYKSNGKVAHAYRKLAKEVIDNE